jgi:hypothetical protein
MSKKVWIAGLLALALVVTVVGVAAAAAPAASAQAIGVLDRGGFYPTNPPGPRGGPGAGPQWQPPHLKGEIISIASTTSFTMSGPDDHDITVTVGDTTSYIGSLTAFADLHVGDEVAVDGRRSEGGLEARVIIDADSLPLGIPVGGEVTAVTSSKLTIELRDGLSFNFTVDASTDFLSRENAVTSISDVKVGDHVVVVFDQASSATLTANLILVGGEPPADQPDSGG